MEMNDFLPSWIVKTFLGTMLGATLFWGVGQGIGNNIEYSQGQRVGVINKISERGLIWKTKEGQLSLEGITSTGQPTGAGIWNFSLDRQARHGENTGSIYSLIGQHMEDGKRVKITYIEQFSTWPWRASTTYLVQSVEPLENPKK